MRNARNRRGVCSQVAARLPNVDKDCGGGSDKLVVTVNALSPSGDDRVEGCLAAVVDQLSAALGSDAGDVWVHWLELPPRRVFAGGGLIDVADVDPREPKLI